MNRYFRIFRLGILSILLLYLIITILKDTIFRPKTTPYFIWKNTVTLDYYRYTELFTKDARTKLHTDVEYCNFSKFYLEDFSYDSSYKILCYAVNIPANKIIASLLKDSLNQDTYSLSSNTQYNMQEIFGDYFLIDCYDTIPSINTIHLNFSGEEVKKDIINDTNFVMYSVFLNSFSMKYNNLTENDLAIINSGKPVQFDFLFRKKGTILYFFIITRKDKKPFNSNIVSIIN